MDRYQLEGLVKDSNIGVWLVEIDTIGFNHHPVFHFTDGHNGLKKTGLKIQLNRPVGVAVFVWFANPFLKRAVP
jgi:hypothetical protein